MAPTKRRPVFSRTDAAVLAGLPAMLALAWLLPERNWPGLARRLAPLAGGDLTRDPTAAARAIEGALGDRLPGLTGHAVLRRMAAEGIFGFLQLLKTYRPGDWTPPASLVQGQRIAAALAAGRGAVLWVWHGFHGHLAAKVALADAGFRASHLSIAAHGFSESRFALGWLNRLQAAPEDRFLAERLMMPLDNGPNPALATAARRLAANGIVSLTAQRGRGRAVEVPFLDGRLALASGGPALAQLSGAALLPVFALRRPDGSVEVTVDEPIALRNGTPRDEALTRAVGDYARLLEGYVLEAPGQWLGWLQL